MLPRLCVLLLLITSLPAMAEVYRWVDADGVVHYTDKPHDKSAQPVTLPPLQTFSPSDEAASLPAPDAVQPSSQPEKVMPPAPKIMSPQSQATIRDAQHQVVIEVNAALQPGQGLVYYLDGTPQNATATQATSYQMGGVERGTHRLSVATVDADGKTLATSPSVTIYMKPPTVHHP